jgi:hypothetical protein
LNTPGPLSVSGEWKIGPSSHPSNTEESTLPTHAPHRVTVLQGRRTPGVAIAFGVVVGVLLAGVAIAGRLGMLDSLIGAVVLSVGVGNPRFVIVSLINIVVAEWLLRRGRAASTQTTLTAMTTMTSRPTKRTATSSA